ncbi:MAG: hypothetical protein JNM18_09980, partial [Planctomycetaceae bacterium]|nr:hypothetical protein [Planctomycetaceae bacterium]
MRCLLLYPVLALGLIATSAHAIVLVEKTKPAANVYVLATDDAKTLEACGELARYLH